VGVEDTDAVAAGAAGVSLSGLVGALDEDFLHRAEQRGVAALGVGAEQVQQDLVALLHHRLRHLAVHRRGRGAGANGVLEDVGHVVVARLEQLARLGEVILGLAREADDDVGREIHPRHHGAERIHDFAVALARVGTVHRLEDAVAARLQRQVHVRAQLGQAAIGLDEVLLEAARVRRGEADARDAGDGVHALDQLHEGRDAAGVRVIAPAVAGHDLPEQRHLAHAAGGQLLALAHDLVHRTRALVAARLGHDAEGAVHVAALLDRDEGAHLLFLEDVLADRVLRAGFLRDVHDGLPHRHAGGVRGAQVVEVIGHLVEFLRAHDQVDVRQAVEQLGAAVLRHAAEDAEDEVGLLALAGRDVGGLGDGLLLGHVAHAARVEQHDVALGLRPHDPVSPRAQHRRDSLAVALVHLAPVGFDMDPVHVGRGPK